MVHLRLFVVFILACSLFGAAQADLAALETEFNAQLAANDVEAANVVGQQYYAAAEDQDDHATAGRIAYAMASIASLRDDKDGVPVWFDRCADHYKALDAAAQQVDCIHKAALSYKALNKLGTTRDRLRSAERALDAANASESIVAALVYADLAESYIPPQFEVGAPADADRERVLDYTQSARAILAANGQEGHFLYATLLAREATAFEDLERFEEAMPPMRKAIEMLAEQPEHGQLVSDLRRRYAKISAWDSGDANKRGPLTVTLEDGREVAIRVKKRTRVTYPRNRNMTSEYGVGTVLVSLDSSGDVANVEVIKSEPTPEFGAAVAKAVKRWSFYPEDETPPESIPPFRYSVTFDIVRRR